MLNSTKIAFCEGGCAAFIKKFDRYCHLFAKRLTESENTDNIDNTTYVL